MEASHCRFSHLRAPFNGTAFAEGMHVIQLNNATAESGHLSKRAFGAITLTSPGIPAEQ